MNQSETNAAADAGHGEQDDREPQPQNGVRLLLDCRLGGPRAQIPPEPCRVDAEQADGADRRDRDLMLARPIADLVREPEQDDDEDGEEQQRRRVVRQPRLEAHDAVLCLAGARDDREAEYEERVREQRAEDRRLGDDDLAGGEREEDDEQLGKVAERGLEHARHSRPEMSAHRLGPDSDRPGEAAERNGGQDEHGDRLRVRVVECSCDGGEREDPAEHEPLRH